MALGEHSVNVGNYDENDASVPKLCLTLSTPWTAAYQAPPPMRFSKQEFWCIEVNNLFLGSAGVPMLVSQLQRVLVDVPLGSRCGLCESWVLVTQERCRLQSSISDVNFSAC